jgi:two-component system OmpR family sensor kinase
MSDNDSLKEQQHKKFLSAAGHEIRGALANIRAYASLLSGPHLLPDDKVRHAADVVRRNADRALQLVSELIDLWSEEVGELEVDLSAEPLVPLLERAAATARGQAERANVAVELDYPPGLPPFPFDPDRVAVVLSAFWGNALRRCHGGHHVKSALRTSPDRVEVSFEDEGRLLSAEQKRGYFQRRYAVTSAGKLDEGLGLCVAAALVRAHGGNVSITQRGTRTVFSFSLPRLAPTTALSSQRPELRPSASGA